MPMAGTNGTWRSRGDNAGGAIRLFPECAISSAAKSCREAYGVRGACSRFGSPEASNSGSKLRALHTLREVRLRAPLLSVNNCMPNEPIIDLQSDHYFMGEAL